MRRAIIMTIAATGFVIASCRAERDDVRLARLGTERPTSDANVARNGLPGITLRRLSTSGYVDFYASSISADGRYMSMIDWSTVDLAVRDLVTGEVHRLTNARRGEGEPYEDAGVSVFSRDGRRIVYGWQYFPDVQPGWGYFPDLQLRVMPFVTDERGVPRATEPDVLFHKPEFDPYYPFDWSPDGRLILAKVYTAGNANQLALISADDGTYRALRSFDWREPLRAAFSPDGRYVAYDFQPDIDSADRDLFVLSVDGTHEARIVEDPANDRLLGWHPDGSILFHSDRGGSPGVWRIAMSEGRANGRPELIRGDVLGVQPIGFAGDRFYYGVDVNPRRFYTAPIDIATGRLTGAPTAIDDPTRIDVIGWDWSADGELLAYSGTSDGANGSTIVIRARGGELVQRVRLDLGRSRHMRWTPDGTLLVFARDDRDRRGFHRIDLGTASYETILRTEDSSELSTPRGHFELSTDGRTLWFAAGNPSASGQLTLVAYDIQSRTSRRLAPIDWPGLVARSPDGARLAIFAPDEDGGSVLGTLSVDGGPVTPLHRIGENTLVMGLIWHPDGRTLVFSTLELPDGENWTTWAVPVDGAAARPVQLIDHVNPGSMRLHPDGRTIGFRAGESRGEVWVMDGLGGR